MQTILFQQAEKAIKDFISRDNSENLTELLLELLNGERWDDEIYYFCDTLSALITLLIDPKVNKKYYKNNPRLNITTGPHLTRLHSFFIQLKTVAKARAEMRLEDMQQNYTEKKECELQNILKKYHELTDNK